MKKIKKVSIFLLAFIMILNISSNVFAGGKWIIIDKVWQFRLDQPHFNGDVYHVHIRNLRNSSKKACIRLDNFKPCDKKSGDWKKNKVPEWVVEEVLSRKNVSDKAKMYNKGLHSFLKRIPKWALVSAAALMTFVSLITIFFPGDDALTVAIWIAATA